MKIAGVEVKDADKPMTITVNKADVRAGAKKNANTCAMANAVCRQTGAVAAKIHFSRAYVKKNGQWLRFTVPPALRSEVLAFDRGGEFAPGEYRLGPIQPTLRLDRPAEKRWKPDYNKTRKSATGKRRKPYHVVSGVRARMMVADWE